jgi:hypothetical protein
MTQYSFTKGLSKTIVSLLVVGIPLVIGVLPEEWANLTLSGVLLLVLNYLKVRYS